MKKLSPPGKRAIRRQTQYSDPPEAGEVREMQLRLTTLLARYQREQAGNSDLAEVLTELQTSLEELFALQADRDDQNRQLQAALRDLDEQQERFRTLFNVMPYAYFMTDRQGRVLQANPAAAELLGQRIDHIVDRPLVVKIAVDERMAFRHYHAQALATGESQTWESALEPRAGARHTPVEVRLKTSDELAGKQRLHWLLTDISQRIESREAIIRSERLSAIGQMVTGLAHESRNALQASQACLSMLALEVRDRPAASELIGRLRAAQHRLVHLYEQVRSYANPPRFDRVSVDLVKLMHEVFDEQVFVHPGRILRLQLLGDQTDLPTALVDRIAMHQILSNIVDNAIGAIPTNPVVISIDWAQIDIAGRPVVQLRLRDNGPGLEPEARRRVFEPFFTTKFKGSGLGMTIVRKLVESHGGSIEMGQDLKEGAEFIINLPR